MQSGQVGLNVVNLSDQQEGGLRCCGAGRSRLQSGLFSVPLNE